MEQTEKRYHFIGIGGIGMSALAHILLQKGCLVSGSDLAHSYVTDGLVQAGAQVYLGHQQENIKQPACVIYSTAVAPSNPEVAHARLQGYPFLHRAQLLHKLMQGYAPLLVAGTHGKTTTSSLLAHLLVEAGLHPAFAVGGIVKSLGSNGGHGSGPYFVAEADESDGSFLNYTPFGAIVTNIDNDHLDYWKDEAALEKGFKQFIDQTTSPQHLLWCGDDEVLRRLAPPGISYGFDESNQLCILNFRQEGWRIIFDIRFNGQLYEEITVPLIGAHNVLNAVAVFGLGLMISIPEEKIKAAFACFKGVSRRAELKGQVDLISIVDDYAHHPTEIFATLHALKQAAGHRRLIAAFQPHRYTRTHDCFAEFGPAFEPADVLILTDIYAAGEQPIPNITSEALLNKIRETSAVETHFIKRSELSAYLAKFLKGDDLLVTMGAGDITQVGPEVIAQLKING